MAEAAPTDTALIAAAVSKVSLRRLVMGNVPLVRPMSVMPTVFDHSRHNGNQRDKTNKFGTATQPPAVPLVPEVAAGERLP
jgi:hypothetical protein